MRLMARSCTAVSNQGGYASHGHSIVANAVTGFRQLYLDRIGHHSTAYTVYTNRPAPGAMRGYGIPQCNFAVECMMDDIAREKGWDPKAFRLANLMPLGYVDPFNGITCHSTGLAECIEKGADFIGWAELREKYQNQTGPVRRGVGMACFSYKTGVYPISLETASARMVLNQDGTVQLHLGATEIGQGGDTVFSQMAAQAIGIPTEDVHIVSLQDTDTAPFDTGAYASRQTYVTGKAIKKVGEEFREKLLAYAAELFPDASGLDIRERQIVDGAGEALISLADLAMTAFYSLEHSVHITAEDTNHCKENTFAFGCCFAEVEVDIPVGKVRVLRIVNVHDSGKLINPALAEAQVHGGMSMGIGYALTEEMKFDPKTGRLLNGNLLDYKMPTSMDHPHGGGLPQQLHRPVRGDRRSLRPLWKQGSGRAAHHPRGPGHPQCGAPGHRRGGKHPAPVAPEAGGGIYERRADLTCMTLHPSIRPGRWTTPSAPSRPIPPPW